MQGRCLFAGLLCLFGRGAGVMEMEREQAWGGDICVGDSGSWA